MDKEQEIPRKVRYLIQFFHALTAGFVGFAAFLNIINADTLGGVVLCVYLFCFGSMICAFETPLKVLEHTLSRLLQSFNQESSVSASHLGMPTIFRNGAPVCAGLSAAVAIFLRKRYI